MSRARQASHVYVVAPNPAQAAERLAWNWDQQRRHLWVSERVHPDRGSADRLQHAARIAHLRSERDQLVRSIPPDTSDRLADLQDQQAEVERSLAEMHVGAGPWKNTAVETSSIRLAEAQQGSSSGRSPRRRPLPGIVGTAQSPPGRTGHRRRP